MDNVTQLWVFRLTSLVGIASASIFCTSSKWSLYPLLFRLWFSLSFLRSVKKLMASLAWQFPTSSSANWLSVLQNITHYTWGYVHWWYDCWISNISYFHLFPILPTFISLPFTCFGEFCEPQPQPTWNSDPLGAGPGRTHGLRWWWLSEVLPEVHGLLRFRWRRWLREVHVGTLPKTALLYIAPF